MLNVLPFDLRHVKACKSSSTFVQDGDNTLDQVPGKTFGGPGQIPIFSNFFRPGLGQVWSKIFSWYQA